MLTSLARNWWVLLLNGICAIAFAFMAFAWPGLTLLLLVVFYGVYCLIDGATAVGASLSRDAKGKPWGQMLLIGIVSILAGIAALAWPGMTAVVLLVIIALWAIVHGICEIVAAIELRKVIDNEWLLILAGVLSILFGLVLIARPGVGALTVTWLIATFALFHGILLVALSFKVRGLGVAKRILH